MDLSSCTRGSINAISKETCSCHYTWVMVAAQTVLQAGQGVLLAKMDLKQAYHNIPVAPEARHLLCFHLEDRIYVDLRLPFGCRSALFIFSSIADDLLQIMQCNGVTWEIHYSNDFLTIGAPASDECHSNMEIMCPMCEKAGYPLNLANQKAYLHL